MKKTKINHKIVTSLAVGVLTIVVLAALIRPSISADVTWDGDTDNLWGTLTNWDNDALPGNADTAVIGDIGTGGTISLDSARVKFVKFDAYVDSAWTLGAGAVGSESFTLSNGGGLNMAYNASNAADQVVNAGITLGSGSAATTLTMTVWGANLSLTLNGAMVSGTSGNLTFRKAGSGTLKVVGDLTGIETWDNRHGTVQITAENLEDSMANSTGYYGGGHTSTDGIYQLIGSGDATIDAVQFSIGTTTAGDTGGLAILNTGSGVIDIGTAAGTGFNVARSDATAARTLTLGGSNTGDNTIIGKIQDNNTGSGGIINVVKQDEGKWILAGNNTYTGSTTVDGGTLEFEEPADLYGGTTGDWTPANIIVEAGGILSLQAGSASQFSADNINTLFTNLSASGTGGFETGSFLGINVATDDAVAVSTALTDGGDAEVIGLVKAGAGTLALSGANTYSGGTTISAGTLQLNPATGVTSTLSGVISGAGTLLKDGDGTLVLSGNSTLTGTTSLTTGTLQLSQGDELSSSAFSFTGGTLDTGTNSTLTFGSLSGDQDITMNGAGDGTQRMQLVVGGNNTDTTYSGDLTGSSATPSSAGLTKNGTGTFTMTGTSSFSGTFKINDGTVVGTGASFGNTWLNNEGTARFDLGEDYSRTGRILGSGALVKSGSAKMTLNMTASNSIYTGGWSIEAGTLQGTTDNILNNVAMSDNSTNLIFAQSSDGTYAGDVTGTGTLTKWNTGTVTMSGAHAATISTTVVRGTLVTDGTSITGPLAFSVGSGNQGTAQWNFDSSTVTHTGVISSTGAGTATLQKSGSGTLVLQGDNTFTGTVAVDVGQLTLDTSASGSALGGTTAMAVASGATLLINQSNQIADGAAMTLSGGTISRSSGVSETMGTLDLSADSTIDYISGSVGTLAFEAYEGGSAPDFVLTVNNFATGNVLILGSDMSSYLSSTTGTAFSNAYFAFNDMSAGGFTSAWDSGSSTFSITAVPEPSTYLAGGLLLLLIGGSFLRRRLAASSSLAD